MSEGPKSERPNMVRLWRFINSNLIARANITFSSWIVAFLNTYCSDFTTPNLCCRAKALGNKVATSLLKGALP